MAAVFVAGYAADALDRTLDERQGQVCDRAYHAPFYTLSERFGVLSLVLV